MEVLPRPLGTTSFLLELLYFAGWQLEVRDGETGAIRATRANVELDVGGATLSDAVETLFMRAMRSGSTPHRGVWRASVVRSAPRKSLHRSST
jgi:hypothetical protein